jgi:hypothetical protein
VAEHPNVSMLAFQEWMELGGKVKEGEHSLRIKGYQLRLFHNSQTRGAQGEPPEDAGEGRLTSSQGGRPSRSPLNSPCKCGADQTRPVPFISNCVGYMNFFLNQNRRHGLISSLIIIGMPGTLAIRVANLPDDTA